MICSYALQAQHNQLKAGDALYDKQNYVKAEETYKSAGGYAASYNAGNAAYQQGKYEEAADLFRIAVNAGADAAAKSAAWYNMGNAYLQASKYADAVKAYENSLRQQPNRPDAKKNLQIAKKKQNEDEIVRLMNQDLIGVVLISQSLKIIGLLMLMERKY